MREKAVMTEFRGIKTVLDEHLELNDYLPDNTSIETVLQDDNINWTGVTGGITDPWGNAYYYRAAAGNTYIVVSKGRDELRNSGDEIFVRQNVPPTRDKYTYQSGGSYSNGVAW
ncbi:MAG: type II secretion system protein GspG [Bacillota bacterium]